MNFPGNFTRCRNTGIYFYRVHSAHKFTGINLMNMT